LWPEFETPNEFVAEMKGQLDPSMSKFDVAMLPTRASEGDRDVRKKLQVRAGIDLTTLVDDL
jgi:hypothetical protein